MTCSLGSSSSALVHTWHSLLTHEKILDRWAENINSVLNRPSSINDEAIKRLPNVKSTSLLAILPSCLKLRKPSACSPVTQLPVLTQYQQIINHLVEKLTELFVIMWDQKSTSQDFKNASIIHVYKRKGHFLRQSQRHIPALHSRLDSC